MSSPTPPRPGRPPYVTTPPPRPARPSHSLPAGAHVADRRGLTAAGGVVLILALGLAGGAYDLVTGSELRLVFGICFVAGCVLAALLVHREDLGAAVVMPPLVYVLLAVISGVVEPTGRSGSILVRQAIEIGNAVVLGAPILLLGTAAAALLVGARWLGTRGQ